MKSSQGHSAQRSGLEKAFKPSSARWIERQLKDPYVIEARKKGYRSRASFKLLELDARFHFMRAGRTALDLGAYPGGWTQVLVAKGMRVLAIDLLVMRPIPQATCVQGDLMDPLMQERIHAFSSVFDLVLSDAAPNTTGHRETDHLQCMRLVEHIWQVSKNTLAQGGNFVCKIFEGHSFQDFRKDLHPFFSKTFIAHPKASRKESCELYLVGQNFRSIS